MHLVRGQTGWSVRGARPNFPADTDRIYRRLVKLAEAESGPERAAGRKPAHPARARRAQKTRRQGAGTAVELKDGKGGALGRLLSGKKIMKASATASLGRAERTRPAATSSPAGDDKTVLAVGDPLNEAEAKARDWLVKDLLRAEGSKTISSSEDGKLRWTVTRDTESMDWKLIGSRDRPDLQKATDLASSLGWVNLVDVVPDPAKVDTGLDHPVVIRPRPSTG